MLKPIDFKIIWPTQILLKNIIYTRFKVAFQTTDKTIERVCATKWPNLMKEGAYTQSDLRELQLMKVYIKTNLDKKDLDNIHEYFYTKRFIHPCTIADKMTDLKIIEADAKKWTDELPFLELEGEITFDVNKLFKKYFEKKWIKVESKDKLTKQIIEFKFIKPFPLLTIYDKPNEIKIAIRDILDSDLNKRNSYWIKIFEKIIEHKNFHTWKKDVEFSTLDKIQVIINDSIKLLGEKISENKTKMAFGLLAARSYIKNRRK
mgnify:CR=1 FL=1